MFVYSVGDLNSEVITVLHFLPHKDAAPFVETHKRLDDGQENAASILVKSWQLDCYRFGEVVACRIIRNVGVIRDVSIITETCCQGWGLGAGGWGLGAGDWGGRRGKISLIGELVRKFCLKLYVVTSPSSLRCWISENEVGFF